MGQAAKRGTREQRVAQAISRNEALAQQIEPLPETEPVKKMMRRHGVNKLAIAMMMAGVLMPMPKE